MSGTPQHYAEANRENTGRQALRRMRSANRVWALIRAPLSPWIKEQTIQSLLDDPETREETIVQLNLRRTLSSGLGY